MPGIAAVVFFALLGLGLVEVGYLRAAHGGNLRISVYLFFAGLIFIFFPAAVRILMRSTARAERVTLVILLGVFFYVVKVLESPSAFVLFDEFIHLRNTQDILASGHLFEYNPLLPTAAYYPGLAAVTATLVNLTGLSTFMCGLIVIGVARVVISASFYLVAEKVTGSSRGAGAASLLYAANPCFLRWSAQFAYEDLALPLAAFTVWWISRTREIRAPDDQGRDAQGRGVRTRDVRGRDAAQVITVVSIVAVTVSHHIAAFALCGILAMLWVAERVLKYPREERRYVGIFAALSGLLAVFWFFVVAKPASDYLLGQNIDPVIQEVISLVTLHGGPRPLYSGTSDAVPKWYVLVGFAAILIVMAALAVAVLRGWRMLQARGGVSTARHRASIAVAMIIAISFPLTLLPRLTSVGGAVSARTSEFVYFAIGCTVGLLMESAARSTRFRMQSVRGLVPGGGLRTVLVAVVFSLVLIGQVSIGNSFYSLMPDAAVGFPIYVQSNMITAADWSAQHLGVHQTFATDSTDQLALGAYGDEDPADVNVIYPMFFTGSMNSTVVNMIKSNQIHYVLLNWLATQEVPALSGSYYYSDLEPDYMLDGKPLPKAYYSKFSAYTCSHLVYQSGPIQIYDVSQIANGTCQPRLIHSAPTKASSGKKPGKKKAVTS